VIVTTPQPAAQKVAKRAADTAQRYDLEIAGVVENMSGFTTPSGERLTIFGECGGQVLPDELDVPLLGKVPHEHALRVSAADAGRLVTFQSDSPGAIRRSVPIRGLEEGERVQGIDVRPGDGRLYGVGDSSRLLRLDPVTGQATPVGPDPFSPTLRGQSIGFDF